MKGPTAFAVGPVGLLTVAENVGTGTRGHGEIFHGGVVGPLHKVNRRKAICLVMIALTGVRDIATIGGKKPPTILNAGLVDLIFHGLFLLIAVDQDRRHSSKMQAFPHRFFDAILVCFIPRFAPQKLFRNASRYSVGRFYFENVLKNEKGWIRITANPPRDLPGKFYEV